MPRFHRLSPLVSIGGMSYASRFACTTIPRPLIREKEQFLQFESMDAIPEHPLPDLLVFRCFADCRGYNSRFFGSVCTLPVPSLLQWEVSCSLSLTPPPTR